MKMVIANFAHVAGGWRVEKHPRFLADVTGDGLLDVVGFGDAGVWVSHNNKDGSFGAPTKAVDNFAYEVGGWRVEKHPRFLADLTGDGRADIVGFGDAGVWVSFNNGDGTFAAPTKVVDNFAYEVGGWRVEKHPRFLADLTGDGRADIVGFGDAGVWVSFNNGDGSFGAPTRVLDSFGHSAGGWRVHQHPRFLADLTGDGRADIVGFGDAGVWVSLNNGDGTFGAPTRVVDNFAWSAGGWRVARHPRFLADLTGDGRADIVGFGDAGVWVSFNNGDGTFGAPTRVVDNFAYSAGGWRVARHPRFLADLTGDGHADIVGFGDAGVWVSRNNGDRTFTAPTKVIDNFAHSAGGWRVERHPRLLADMTGDGRTDIVGFGDHGVWLAEDRGDGTFVHVRTRHDIWDLEAAGPWDPTTLAYANAIKALQARPLADPTSWAYLSAVHGRSGPALPGTTWNACQHGSWYFLSWHRMYLHHFERIVRAEVVAQGGSEDWALPYWDHGAPGRAALPPAFRQPSMPDGSANPLFLPRAAGMNTGAQLPPSATSTSAAMAATQFVATFGGGITSPQHFFGAAGRLEQTPHNIVHVLLGGLMVDPNQAALDPIFWLHHCDIDRLWEVWLAQGGGRQNPAESQWQSEPFVFHDEDGTQVSIRGADVVDTVAQLGYRYDGVAPPASDVLSPALAAAAAGDSAPAELVGASEEPVDLTGAPTRVAVVIDRPSADLAERDAPAAAPRTVTLNLEDIEGERSPTIGYELFLQAGGDEATPHYVGTVSFFGIEHMSVRGPDVDGPHGMRLSYDITGLVQTLTDQGEWDGSRLSVSFRPLGLIQPSGTELADDEPDVADEDAGVAEATATIPVRVGRISVFYG